MVRDYCKNIPENLQEDQLPMTTAERQRRSIYYDEFAELLESFQENNITRAGIANIQSPEDRELFNENAKEFNQFIRDEIRFAEGNFEDDFEDRRIIRGENIIFSDFEEGEFEKIYPNIKERLIQAPYITPIEVDDFIDKNLLPRKNFRNYLVPGNRRILSLFNDFLSPKSFSNAAMGSFCALVPNIFAAVSQIKGAFNSAMDSADDLGNLIEGIQDISLSGLLESLKEQMMTAIDQIVNNMKNKISNITDEFLEDQFPFNQHRIMAKIIKEKDKISGFFSEDTVDNIKKKVEGMISYAASIFEELDIEEIQYLILRFCGLLGEIEEVMEGKTKKVEDVKQSYEQTHTKLKTSGNPATAKAIEAGAIRYPEAEREEKQKESLEVPNINTDEPSKGGQFGSEPFESGEAGEVPSWEEIIEGRSNMFEFANGGVRFQEPYSLGANRSMGRAGWERAQPKEKMMLCRVQKSWGQKIAITSAFRDEAYNRALSGAANRSLHLDGRAFDIAIPRGRVQERFIVLAIDKGFRGIGRYNGFVHIDTGNRREW